MCQVEHTLRRALTSPKAVVRPESLVYKLKRAGRAASVVAGLFFSFFFFNRRSRCLVIAKSFRLGHQQDAHECLRYLVDGMEEAVLHGRKQCGLRGGGRRMGLLTARPAQSRRRRQGHQRCAQHLRP